MPVELREVVLRDKPVQMLQASPKGTVPVLVLPDGQVLEQSLDIMRYALTSNDPQGWWPPSDAALVDQRALIERNDTVFKGALDRYKYPQRFGLTDNRLEREAGEQVLAALEAVLTAEPYLSGAAFGLADAAIAPFVRQWAHVDPADFAGHVWPRLQEWLEAFEHSELFVQTMDKHPAWRPGQAACLFPPELA